MRRPVANSSPAFYYRCKPRGHRMMNSGRDLFAVWAAHRLIAAEFRGDKEIEAEIG